MAEEYFAVGVIYTYTRKKNNNKTIRSISTIGIKVLECGFRFVSDFFKFY